MTNQELKEKLLEEFEKESDKSIDNNYDKYEGQHDVFSVQDDIYKWLSTKLDALLLSDDEVININDIQCMKSAIRCLEEEGFNHPTIEPKRRLLKKLERIKNQRDKLITKG